MMRAAAQQGHREPRCGWCLQRPAFPQTLSVYSPPVCAAVTHAAVWAGIGAAITPAAIIGPRIVGASIPPVWPVECSSISVIARTVSVRVAVVGGGAVIGWIA